MGPWGPTARNLWGPTTRDPRGQGTEDPWRYTTTGSWKGINTGSFTTNRPDLACTPSMLISRYPWLLPTRDPYRQPVNTENDSYTGDTLDDNSEIIGTEYPYWTTQYWKQKMTERGKLANTRNEEEYTL